MPKYQVPQFIDTETKLIGPLTLKQFLFVASGISVVVLEYLVLPGIFFFVIMLPTAAFFLALAFMKIDGQPFLNYLAYMLGYTLGTKRYTYQVKNPNGQTINH